MSVAAFIKRKYRISDVLMNYHFHVLDVSVESPIVLSLAYGFQGCTAPEISVSMKEIKEGTFPYPHKVMQSASVNDITLTNGAKFFDSDFYDWIAGYVRGEVNQRRNFLIIQFSQISTSAALGQLGLPNLLPAAGSTLQPFFDLVGRIPARAWLLHSCTPLRYKASTDFDALSTSPSLQEVTISTRYIEEFNSGV